MEGASIRQRHEDERRYWSIWQSANLQKAAKLPSFDNFMQPLREGEETGQDKVDRLRAFFEATRNSR